MAFYTSFAIEFFIWFDPWIRSLSSKVIFIKHPMFCHNYSNLLWLKRMLARISEKRMFSFLADILAGQEFNCFHSYCFVTFPDHDSVKAYR